MRCQPLIAALVGTLMCTGIQAQGTEDFLNLSLEDLPSIEVYSVSRKEEAGQGVDGDYVGRINATQQAISFRGPWETLRDSNAVNSVTNIITRNATETQGDRFKYLGLPRTLAEWSTCS
ncbi:MAG: hypothetical protein AAF358_03585 [Pseudomonadota bacterium]